MTDLSESRPLAIAYPRRPASGRARPLVWRATLLCALAVFGVSEAVQAQMASEAAGGAAAAEPVRRYEVAAGPLATVLNLYVQAAGVLMSFDASALEGLHSPGVQGNHSVAEGFRQVLQGSGFEAVATGPGRYGLRKASARMLEEVKVIGALEVATEGTGSYTTEGVNLGRLTQRLQEVPRSISVITRAQLDDQRLASFNDVIEQLPGVTLTPADGWGGGGYYARGHEITSFLVDGAPSKGKTEGDFSFNTSMAKYDSVQFLHGPDGLFSGNGQPSGTINLVRKRPLNHFQFKTTMSAGSWQNYLGEIDLNGVLQGTGNVRGRLVAAYNDTHKFYDYAHRKSSTLYGVFSVDLTPQTTLTAGFSHDARKGRGQDYPTAFPRYVNGELLPVPRSLGLPPFSYMDSESDNVFAEFEHHLNQDWMLRASTSHTWTKNSVLLPYYNGAVNPATGQGTTFFNWMDQYEGKVKAHAFDANLSGKFQALERRHRVMLGVDYLRTHNTGAISNVTGLPGTPIDWATFDPGDYTEYQLSAAASFRDNLNIQKGIYGYGDFQLHGPLRLVLGGRYARYENEDGRYRLGALSQPSIARNSGYFLPYYALVLDVNDNWSAYATMARSYEDQSHRYSVDHTSLSPTTGRSFELGFKGEHFDGRLNTNITFYRTDRKNYAVKVDDDPGFDVYGGSCCYSGDGRFRARGVEVQVSGELAPGWQINAGYTYDDNETSYGSGAGERYNTATPKHIFRLWTSYQLHGKWSALKIGGGVQAQSSYYKEGSVKSWNPSGGADGKGAYDGPAQSYQFTDPGRAIWNVFVEYAFHKNWTAALNVNNVFDKRYLQAVGTTAGGNIYGEPRSVYLTVRGRFQ